MESDFPKATIRIVGTSHVAKESVRRITTAYDALQPDIVCVELDPPRLRALQDEALGKKQPSISPSMIRVVGISGYVFALIARAVQKKIGNVLNVKPGLDMLEAINLAKKDQKQLFLIDQRIDITLRRFSQKFTFCEKLRVLSDVIFGPFQKQKIKIDLRKIPDEKMIDEFMEILRQRYPSIYEVLIIERNIVMARNLDGIVRKHPGAKILVVIGAGHGKDLRERLKLMERIADIT